VSRPDANFRGYAGTIASGEISVGDSVLALPSRKSSKVREITTADGPLAKAGTAQAVTIVLEDEIDLSRGDVLVHPDHRPTLARTFDANLLWMGEAPLLPGKRYEFKIGSRYVKGLVDSIQHRIDVNDLSTREAEALDLNGLARVRIALEEPVAVDDYKLSRATGSFIIIDLLHFGTVGAGMVIAPQGAQSGRVSNEVVWQPTRVSAQIRANQKNQRPAVIWFTGLSGAGKSTLANALEQALVQRGHHSYLLDGDNVRHGLNKDLDFSEAGREENIRRIGEVSALFVDAGLIVVTAFISPFRADRNKIRERIGDTQFIEVYVSTSLEECERRDPKGLYVKARAGAIKNFTGIDSPYEPPINPQLSIDTSKVAIGEAVGQIVKYLENKGFLHQADPGL
jgi:bifunctional enzyme CysN/CysC